MHTTYQIHWNVPVVSCHLSSPLQPFLHYLQHLNICLDIMTHSIRQFIIISTYNIQLYTTLKSNGYELQTISCISRHSIHCFVLFVQFSFLFSLSFSEWISVPFESVYNIIRMENIMPHAHESWVWLCLYEC